MKAARYVVARLILGLAVLLFPSGPVKIPPRANLPSPQDAGVTAWKKGRSRSAAKCRTRNVVGFPASLTSRSMEPRRYRRLHGGVLEDLQNTNCWPRRGLPRLG